MAAYIDLSRTKNLRTTDGTNYSYYHTGPSSPGNHTILLLHGFPCSAYDWRHMIPLLSKAGFGIVAPDLLGYGGTDKPSDPARYLMKVMSSHIDEILEHEQLDKVVAVAHDWGSGLLSRLLLYLPGRFLASSFISLPYLPPTPVDIEALNEMAKQTLGWELFGYWAVLIADNGAAMIENNFNAFESVNWAADKEDTKNHAARKGALEAWLKDSNSKCPTGDWITASELDTSRKILLGGGFTGPTNWYKQSSRGLGDADDAAIPEDARKIKIPTQFVATLDDVICEASIMRKVTEPWVDNLTVTEIQAGHWVLLEKPKELADSIIDFIHKVT